METKKTYLTHDNVKDIFNDIYDKLVIKTELGKEKIRTDEEWEELINLANLLDKKYSCTLAKHLILGCMEAIDENECIYRRKLEKQKSTPPKVSISDLSKQYEPVTEQKQKQSTFKRVR